MFKPNSLRQITLLWTGSLFACLLAALTVAWHLSQKEPLDPPLISFSPPGHSLDVRTWNPADIPLNYGPGPWIHVAPFRTLTPP